DCRHRNGAAFTVADMPLREASRNTSAIRAHNVLHGPLQLSSLAPVPGPFRRGDARSRAGVFLEDGPAAELNGTHDSEIHNVADLEFFAGSICLELDLNVRSVGHVD